MNLVRFAVPVAIVVMAVAGLPVSHAQDSAAIEHASRVLDLLRQEKFDDVASEFNEKVAALMSSAQLAQVWSALRQQVGPLGSVIDRHASTAAAGVTTVVLGCQFEKTALNVMVAFDAANKIAGLRFIPRPAPAEASAPPPASSRFREESVTVGSGELALPGTLSMPAGQISGAVVLVHGSGPHDRDETIGPNKPFRDLGWGLADRGIAVLRYEKRTRQHAARIAGSKTFTVREEVIDDAILAAALLRQHDRIDPKRVFVLGHSLGGTLAPRIAAAESSLAGLIVMAGTTRPVLDVAREQLTYLASLNPAGPAPDQGVEQLRKMAPETYWKDLDSYDPARTAAKLSIPMLILQGERDYQVTLADLQGWRTALEGRANVTIKSYPTLNHLFLPGEGKSTPAEYDRAGQIPAFVLDDIAGWIGKR
jgi:dienelactone hydrolase